MNDQLEIVTQMLVLSSVLAGFTPIAVEAIKNMFNLKKNYIPVITIVIGALLGFLSIPLFPHVDVYILLWAGALSGSAGVGVHEAVRKREGYTKE